MLNKRTTCSPRPRGRLSIPVTMGEKSFLKKEPAPDYETLERYVLSVSEATKPHPASTYVYADKSSSIIIINSKRDAHISMTVEYVTTGGGRDHLRAGPEQVPELRADKRPRGRLYGARFFELENFKMDLVKLTSDGKTVFEDGKLDPRAVPDEGLDHNRARERGRVQVRSPDLRRQRSLLGSGERSGRGVHPTEDEHTGRKGWNSAPLGVLLKLSGPAQTPVTSIAPSSPAGRWSRCERPRTTSDQSVLISAS